MPDHPAPPPQRLDQILGQHPFFDGMQPAVLEVLAGCARNERYDPGQWLFREGGGADRFYLIRHGSVALEIARPGCEPLVVQTLHDGDILGWAWMVPPYRWTTSARARSLTRIISLDGSCLRGKCEHDHSLGYAMHRRFLPVVADRLAATRMQLLDLYAGPGTDDITDCEPEE